MHRYALYRSSAFAALLILAAGAASAQACPDWQLGGQQISTDGETAWVPQTYPTNAGGSVMLGGCNQFTGTGYVTPAPTFSITYDPRNTGRDLDFRIDAQNCDTVILVNDATAQWHFNDDADGALTSRVRIPAAGAGRYDVWVGTYNPQSCAANLVVETFPASGTTSGGGGGTGTTGTGTTGTTGGGTAAAPTCPEWSLGGAEVRVSVGGSDSRDVVAGGSVDLFANAQACGIPAHGYVAQSPDFTLYYEAPEANADLILSVNGQCDTTLLVNDLNAQWLFNDDMVDLHPQIVIPAAASGRYDIWVGTFGSDLCQSSISMVSQLPAPPTPPQPSK
jgi:hypothetical protein